METDNGDRPGLVVFGSYQRDSLPRPVRTIDATEEARRAVSGNCRLLVDFFDDGSVCYRFVSAVSSARPSLSDSAMAP